MEKDYLLQITNEVYRLTLLFPKKEPLRYKMREVADEILAGLVAANYQSSKIVLQKLDVLNSFFELAKSQNWTKTEEALQVQGGYIKLRELLEKDKSEEIKDEAEIGMEVEAEREAQPFSMNEREQRILEVLRERGRAQVWEIKKIFPDVSKRTLRRDFGQLLREGIIVRIGERNETFYQLS